MASVVLVAGAGLGAWAWERVAPQLEDRGHDVHTVTLTGFGDRAHLARPDVDLTTHTADIVAAVRCARLDDVVLVGHSYSALPAVAAAQELAGRVTRLVLVAGAWVEDGQSLFDSAPEQAAIMQAIADATGDGWRVPFLTEEQIDTYVGDHGLSAEDQRWLQERSTAQPIGIYRTPLHRDDDVLATMRRTYVRCLGDHIDAPVAGSPGWEIVDLDAGHWPMASAPQALTDVLDRVASAASRPRRDALGA